MNKENIYDVVCEIIETNLSDEELGIKLDYLKKITNHPSPSNLIFWPKEDYEIEEIVDIFMNYKVTGFTGLRK